MEAVLHTLESSLRTWAASACTMTCGCVSPQGVHFCVVTSEFSCVGTLVNSQCRELVLLQTSAICMHCVEMCVCALVNDMQISVPTLLQGALFSMYIFLGAIDMAMIIPVISADRVVSAARDKAVFCVSAHQFGITFAKCRNTLPFAHVVTGAYCSLESNLPLVGPRKHALSRSFKKTGTTHRVMHASMLCCKQQDAHDTHCPCCPLCLQIFYRERASGMYFTTAYAAAQVR